MGSDPSPRPMASPLDWSSDRRLDLFVLGPMGDDPAGPASTLPIRDALRALLTDDEEIVRELEARGVTTTSVLVPEDIPGGDDIIDRVLRGLDTSDLAVFNLNAKVSNPDRANVLYELGLVHALGVPSLLVLLQDSTAPFYTEGLAQTRVADFEPATLRAALRPELLRFIRDGASGRDYVNDRVSLFYGMPVVDISAAVGLATGYYFNFLSRLIDERGLLAFYPDAVRHVVYVRPSSLRTTYQADKQRLRDGLSAAGLDLETTKDLDEPPTDQKGPVWFDHVGAVVVDLPRTIYPLVRSPRLLSFLDRNRQISTETARRQFDQRRTQLEGRLLDNVKSAIEYQVLRDVPNVRAEMLHFTTIGEAPALVRDLLG